MSEPIHEPAGVDPGPVPEGQTTIDDKLTFEPERLSYEAASEINPVIV